MRVIAAALAGLTLAAAAAAAPAQPVLRITGTAPMILRGANFHAHERVTIVLMSPKPLRLMVRTNANGAFRMQLPVVGSGRCQSFIVSALGSRGDRAVAGMGTTGCTTWPGMDA